MFSIFLLTVFHVILEKRGFMELYPDKKMFLNNAAKFIFLIATLIFVSVFISIILMY